MGEESSGKYELAKSLCNSNFDSTNNELPLYCLFSNDEKFDDSASTTTNNESTKLHWWIINKFSLRTFGRTILKNCKCNNIGVIITLDFSDFDNCISILRKWLIMINSEISSAITESTRSSWKQDTIKYLSSVLVHRGNADMFECNKASNSNADALNCLDYPVFIVGCNSELLESDVKSPIIKEIIAYIRYICLVTGASFINTSTAKKTNLDLFRKYLMHRMFPSTYSCELNIHVSYKL